MFQLKKQQPFRVLCLAFSEGLNGSSSFCRRSVESETCLLNPLHLDCANRWPKMNDQRREITALRALKRLMSRMNIGELHHRPNQTRVQKIQHH